MTSSTLSNPRANRFKRPQLMNPDAFGRASEQFARYMGTSKFLVQMSLFIAAWLAWNSLAPANLQFDPYTFTFLTLLLSLQASYAAPLILLAQNRQENRDRVALDEDRARAAQTKADTEFLARELAAVRLAVGDTVSRDYLRKELDDLLDELTERLTRGPDDGQPQRPDGHRRRPAE